MSDSIVLQPIEHFVLEGLQKQLSRVFKCRFLLLQSTDKKPQLEKLRGEARNPSATASYPFGFMVINSLNKVEDAYNQKAMVIQGQHVFKANENKAYYATVLPIQMMVNVELYANSFTSVLKFANDWLFAPHLGTLHFNVSYGRTSYPVQVTTNTQLQIPQREAELDNVQEYLVTSDLTIRGWMSRARLAEQEIADKIEVAYNMTEPSTLAQSAGQDSFWAFPKDS